MSVTPLRPLAPRFFAIVPCAGVGARSGASGPKQYAPLGGRAVVWHTLAALAEVDSLAAVLVVLSPEDTAFEQHAAEALGPRCWVKRCGGPTRAASVAAGLQELAARGALDTDWVLVHDAARCLLRPQWVAELVAACRDDSVGGLLALPMADTLKVGNADGRVAATVPRAGKWLAQTPQMFRLGLLRHALAEAGDGATDEASAVEAMGLAPLLVPGHWENLKITWPQDFLLAERLLKTR